MCPANIWYPYVALVTGSLLVIATEGSAGLSLWDEFKQHGCRNFKSPSSDVG